MTQSISKTLWVNKTPPMSFYGPEDHIEGLVVIEEVSHFEDMIQQWYVQYTKLSWWDKIRLFLSAGGCFINVRGT